ncbi:probable calcium-binding protein CML45 [Brachypodium distachyon]|uniref:EF-hand domain-containing protein n=1 Tax=Brachypodium distachyon TaxID=15368 RepID=I1H2K6_BRADI|nr:probable calcium-binding protein CML45 [Brachypodium distachyon]PNT76814.1 hypothetical protein BRADI_1g53830v3 [Brachypodium distachyon]|eukprot:XP_003557374.1 probable calcium-binding protein CML45 [Brachypodium distachyon]
MWRMVMAAHNITIALVSSLLMLILGPLIIDVISVSKKIGRFLCLATKFLADGDSNAIDNVTLSDSPLPAAQLAQGGGLMCTDIEHVTARLGLAARGFGETIGKCYECDAMSAIDELMDDKEASEDELKEAFYVFDRDEDGFICSGELWNVMRRLGWKEGARHEDCVRMIHAFDEDGDGKISFLEFTHMMENAI